MVKALIFDWGDTLMRDDPNSTGPMVTWPQVEAIPGAAEALAELRARNLILCVASNAGASDAELMGQALARVDLRRYFDHLWTSRDLGTAKPEPAFFSEAVRRAGVSADQCTMVGNDYRKDIVGAKSAGLRTIWLDTRDERATHASPAADAIIGHLRELPAVVEQLSRT